MLKRTTHFYFQPYGRTFFGLPDPESLPARTPYSSQALQLSNKSISSVKICDKPVFVKAESGIVLLAVSKDGGHYEYFVIHRTVRISPKTYFGYLSITSQAEILQYQPDIEFEEKQLDKEIVFEPTITRIHIKEIFASFFQVRNGGYSFPAESHPYYEMVYIDHGAMDTTVNGKNFPLGRYDLMIYPPGERHSHRTKPDENCSYLTVLFQMDDGLPEQLSDRIFHCRKDIYHALCRFMQVVQNEGYLNSELAILYLKEVIILLHQFDTKQVIDSKVNPTQMQYESNLLNEILAYISSNLYSAFSIEELCSRFSISRSSLQNLFRTNLHVSPKQYISDIKLERAKQLILLHNHSISEISDLLGFTSIHYFSRKFKVRFGISPTEYARSINQ